MRCVFACHLTMNHDTKKCHNVSQCYVPQLASIFFSPDSSQSKLFGNSCVIMLLHHLATVDWKSHVPLVDGSPLPSLPNLWGCLPPAYPRMMELIKSSERSGGWMDEARKPWIEVVSKIFYFHPDPWGNDAIWLIFYKWVETSWNHQLE